SLPLLFFLNCLPSTDLYTLSLHDALPIFVVTSKPSRFNASLRRLAKYTLLSIKRTLMGRGAGVTDVPPLCCRGQSGSRVGALRDRLRANPQGPASGHLDSTLQ